MKKIFPFLVLWVFLSGSGGYFFAFKISQFINTCKINRKVSNNTNDSSLTLFVFRSGEEYNLKWIKKQKEFIYHGQMYDVVRIITVGRQIRYYCINDTKEKELVATFKKRNRSSGHSNQVVRKITQSHFVLFSLTPNTFRQMHTCCYSQPVCFYLPPFSITFSPPPKNSSIS